MSSEITVQDLIDYARSHVKLAPLAGIGSIANQPGLRFANKIKRRIISQAFNWRWNKASMPSFLTVEGEDEYVIPVGDLGWLDEVRVEREALTVQPRSPKYLDVRRSLKKASYRGEPEAIAVERADNGQLVLRFNPVPSAPVYRVYPIYQAKVTKLEALTDTFDPIPDDFEDVLSQFFVAFAYKLVDRRDHLTELAEAERLLLEYKANLEPEENNAMFYPQRSLSMG